MKCDSCGREWPEHEIDSKPPMLRKRRGLLGWIMRRLQVRLLRVAADEGEDFTWHEGPCCFGPAYVAIERLELRWWNFDSEWQQRMLAVFQRLEAQRRAR